MVCMDSCPAQLAPGGAEIFKKNSSLKKKRGGWGGGEKKNQKKVLVKHSLLKNLLCLWKPEQASPSPPVELAQQAAAEAVSLHGCGNCRAIRNKKASKCRSKQTSKGVSSWDTTALDNLAQLTQMRSTAAIFRLRAVFYLAAAL